MAGVNSCLIYVMVVIELMAVLMIALISAWVIKYGTKGLGFDEASELYNLHAILMPIGAVALPANGIVMYRAFRKYRAKKVKWAHFIFQLLALIFIILGFTFTIMGRNKEPEKRGGGSKVKHFYSIHSWLGLVFVTLFILQFLGGLFAFLFKVVEKSTRELFAAVHAFFGIFTIVLACLVAIIGLEARAKTESLNYDELETDAVLCNTAAVVILILLAHVLYISVNPFFEWDVLDETLESNPIE